MDVTATIDISGLASGTVYVFYGDFRGTPTLSAVMKDTSGVAPDIVIEEAHLNGDFANRAEYYVAELDFVTDGIYDVIEYVWNARGDNGTNGRFGGTVLTGTAGSPQPESFQLTITPNETPGLYDFEWDSQPGKVYDLLTSTDLATPIATWPVYDPDGEGGNPPYADIPATGTTTTLTEVPGDGPKRFFAMAERDAPPLFSWDFEEDGGGFTQIGTPNDWAWGTPNSDNGVGLVLTTGNGGSTGAWATNLGTGDTPPSGVIDPAANSILRSPDIDLTGITGAQFSFAATYDAKAGDVIEILVKEVGTDNQLGDPITPVDTTSDTSSNWTTLGPFDLSAADNTDIYLEFRYQGSDALYIGLYIDDVVVTRN